MFSKPTLKIFLGVLFFITPLFCSALSSQGYVNDFANILSNDSQLEQQLADFEKQTSNEIAVVTVSSLEGLEIEEYAVRLFEDWQIGKKTNDNGVLFLIAPSERVVRIETGYGLEGALPDALAHQIIRKEILPYFKKNDYELGVLLGVQAIMAATQGEYEAASRPSASQPNSQTKKAISSIFGFILWMVIIFLIIRMMRGKGGRGSGGLGWFILGSMLGRGLGGGRGGLGGGSGFGGFGGGRSGGGGSSGSW